MIELHKGREKIYLNPKFIEALIELEQGTKIVLNSGTTVEVDDFITDIEYELRELSNDGSVLSALFGGDNGS